MALLDHFHPPLSLEPSWHSIHNGWSYNLAAEWHKELAVGQPLPNLPLWLRGEGCLPVLLQPTYQKTCADLRITSKSHA